MVISPSIVVERNRNDTIRVERRRSQGHTYDTLAVRTGGRWRWFADERVPDGPGTFFNDDVDDTYPHEFFLAPSHRWLFVTRKCVHTVNVGYLYHDTGRHFVRVCPRGLRFDEAALEYLGRTLHVPVPSLEDGARVIRFDRWMSHGRGFVFTLDESTDFAQRAHTNEITAAYHFSTGRFRLIGRPRF